MLSRSVILLVIPKNSLSIIGTSIFFESGTSIFFDGLISRNSLVIWDEAPMTQRHCTSKPDLPCSPTGHYSPTLVSPQNLEKLKSYDCCWKFVFLFQFYSLSSEFDTNNYLCYMVFTMMAFPQATWARAEPSGGQTRLRAPLSEITLQY